MLPCAGEPPWPQGSSADAAPRFFQPPGVSSVALAVAPWERDRRGGHQVTVPRRGSHRDTAPSRPLPSLPLQMDPVQKAVISHTFGMPAPLKKKQFISCNICHLRFNSAVSAATDGAGSEWGARGQPLSGPSPTMGQSHPPELPMLGVRQHGGCGLLELLLPPRALRPGQALLPAEEPSQPGHAGSAVPWADAALPAKLPGSGLF